MNIFKFIVVILLFVFCSTATHVWAVDQEAYILKDIQGTTYIVCPVVDAHGGDKAAVAFVYDAFDDKAFVVFYMDESTLDPDVDDYMLKFCSNDPRVFPMERNEIDDPTRDLLCEIKKEDMLQFLRDIEHSNVSTMGLALYSAKAPSKYWVFYPGLIPDHWNH